MNVPTAFSECGHNSTIIAAGRNGFSEAKLPDPASAVLSQSSASTAIGLAKGFIVFEGEPQPAMSLSARLLIVGSLGFDRLSRVVLLVLELVSGSGLPIFGWRWRRYDTLTLR